MFIWDSFFFIKNGFFYHIIHPEQKSPSQRPANSPFPKIYPTIFIQDRPELLDNNQTQQNKIQ